jgi:hypothetical protein
VRLANIYETIMQLNSQPNVYGIGRIFDELVNRLHQDRLEASALAQDLARDFHRKRALANARTERFKLEVLEEQLRRSGGGRST